MLNKIRAQMVFVPTLLWNMLLGRWLKVRNWWDRIDANLIVGALPLESDVAQLAREGVVAVVNTCQEYAGPESAYEKYGIRQLRVPTIDFTHPTLDSVTRAVEFIERETAGGGTVYVHCKAGRARSATVALCWLMKSRGIDPKEAQAILQEKRPHINKYVFARPVVKEFFSRLQASAQGHAQNNG
jgi:atypical dual specificity phosphatase